MHLEELLSGEDLLAIWSLETLQLHQFMILSQYQNFADLIFTRLFFFQNSSIWSSFQFLLRWQQWLTNIKKGRQTKFLEKLGNNKSNH